jgi:Replication protein C (RepC)
MNSKLTKAKHDLAICLAPGLFRSLKRGDYKKLKLDVTYNFGKNELIEFSGPEPLGAEDLRILQGLAAMATPLDRGIILRANTQNEIGQKLRELMELKWQSVHEDALVVHGSLYELCKTIGLSISGSNYKFLRKTIERLWKVCVIAQSGSIRRGFHLLSFYGSDSNEDKIYVALNWRITEAILGNSSYAPIDMDEVRKLKSSYTRILHQRLSAIVPPGGHRFFKPETLASYIWPDPASDSTQRKRMPSLKKALAEIASTGGWKIEGSYSIKRIGKKRYKINEGVKK